jgi:hypothetical protein
MPPAPAEPLGDWERETLRRWSLAPARGVPRRDNARPNIYLGGKSARADRSLAFSAIVDDPDGEPVVGALRFGEHTLGIDRSGSFAAILDTSAWPAGWYPVTATLCDGWSSVSYELGYLEVRHQ